MGAKPIMHRRERRGTKKWVEAEAKKVIDEEKRIEEEKKK